MHARESAALTARLEREGFAKATRDRQRKPFTVGFAREQRADLTIRLGIVRAKNAPPTTHRRPIELGAEPQLGRRTRRSRAHVRVRDFDAPDAPTDFACPRPAALHQQAVTARDARACLHEQPRAPRAHFTAENLSDLEPAMIAGAGLDQLLMIHARQEARPGTPRIALYRALFGGCKVGQGAAAQGPIYRLPVQARGRRDVLGAFEPAFDLE